MDISIIIVNYKTPKLCIDCINSIIENTSGIDYEIIVVDNDSQDNSLEVLREKFDNKITLIASKSNLGFGKANNLGAQYAKGEFLFLLNSDTLLKGNAIKILFDYISSNDEIGIVGGNLFDINGRPMHSFQYNQIDLKTIKGTSYFRTLINAMMRKKSPKVFNYTGKPMEIPGSIIGADLMIRKEIFDRIGGFDKDFFMYFEESEMTCRVHKLGFKVFSVPSAEIIHLEGASLGKGFSSRRLRMYNESAVKYFSKVYGEETIPKCYKALISYCNRSRIKRFVTLNFGAVKALTEEKRILKTELLEHLKRTRA